MSRLQKESSFLGVASTSKESPSLMEGEVLRVTLLGSEWRSSKGGLSTINRELAIQLAKHPNVDVSVYLPRCSEEDRRAARSHNVQLIEAQELPGHDQPIDWLVSLPTGHQLHCIIGHGVPLGRQIQVIQKQQPCKWIQVVHTAPEELGMFKSYEEAIFRGEKKHRAEVKLCELADGVVAIGPKLTDAYSCYLRSSKKDQQVFNLTPSIFTEFSDIEQASKEGKKFSVLLFGHGDHEDFELKGYDIAVEAIAQLKDKSYQLKFVGAPKGKEEKVASKLVQYGISRSQLTVRCLKEDREQLASLFCEADLAIMPSRTEGFGLAGLEALSAGLPVLISGNSGLGEAMEEVPSGSHCVINSEDPKDWADAIRVIRQKKRKVRLEEASLLRKEYAAKYSWQRQCESLIEKMLNLVFADPVTLQSLTAFKENESSTSIAVQHKGTSTYDSTGKRWRNKDEDFTATVPLEIRARGPEAIEAYNDALVKAQTCVKRVPLMFVGQDRSGKTSVKKSLKGICFNPNEDSTIGIEVDTYDFKVTNEIWKTGKKDSGENVNEPFSSFERNTARWIADKLMEEENVANLPGTGSTESENYDSFEETNTLEGGFPTKIASYTEPSESPRNQVNARPSLGEPPLTTREEHDPTPSKYDDDVLNSTSEEVPEGIAKLILQFLQDDWKDDREDIYSMTWDFAGQSVYYVTHPIFLTRRAIYFLVYDLSKNPSDTAIPLVKQGVYCEIEDRYNLKTNLDYLKFWMSSLASLMEQNNHLNLSSEKEVLPKRLPAVFLVCTHADKPYCNRNPFSLAKKIFGDLKSEPYGAHLFDVFCVNNTLSGSESECPEIMRLRERVHEVATELPHVNEAIPIKWLQYENALRVIKENGRKFISLATAKRIASKVCKINKNNEISTLLNFLHDLRVLIHFDDSQELSDLVILDTQWLIDVFKNVITVRSYDSREKNFADLWLKLEKEGILEEKLLKHVWNSLIPQKETHESLIAIMEKFSLLCPWPSSPDPYNKHYLVPSMLRTHPPKMISSLVESAQLPSLFLKFDAGQVPPGLFPRFVLEFFSWCRDKFPRSAPPQFYNNFARFHIFWNQGLSIVLLCHSSTIEVILLSVNNEIGTVDMASIRDFRSQLTLMVDRIWNKFFWVKNFRCDVCFLCPICSHGRVVSFCTQHYEENCKQEKCLHFISESDLGNETPQVFCTKSATARDNRIQAANFAPWISLSEEKLTVIGQRDERLILKGISDIRQNKSCELPGEAMASIQPQGPSVGSESDMWLIPFAQGGNPEYCPVQPLVAEQLEGEFNQLQDAVYESKGTVLVSEGYGEKSLVLPCDVSQSLQSKSVPARDVVCKLLDLPSLKVPAPEDRKWIRCLTRNARDCGRTDVVTFLRKNAPAGTTGPLLEESLSVLKIPSKRRTDLAVRLCGGDEWKTVADKLGFEDAYIRCFDQRFKNPVDVILHLCGLNVGQLYDVLVECEFPALADLL